MRSLRLQSVVFLSLCSGPVFAQTVTSKTQVPERFAAEPAVIVSASTTYALHPDGTSTRGRTVAVRIQSDAALREFGVVAIPFASATETVKFSYVRVRHSDGSVTETPLNGVIEQPEEVTRQAPFYSDLKRAEVPVKDLRVGDTLEWATTISSTREESQGQFWGQDTFLGDQITALDEVIELNVPAHTAITVWTNPALKVKAVESDTAAGHVYRWESTEPRTTTGPDADERKKAEKMRVLSAAELLDARQGKLPSVAWTTFKSWQDVGDWYRALEGSRAQPDARIKARATALTVDAKTPEEKVRALYAYVSSQIRYIGVAFGVGRLQPHEAADVLNNQYGDCKDKATLLSAMLAAAGIPSDAALIGTQIRFNPDVPSPAAFDHMITHLTLDGQDVWLDSTEEIAPYRMLFAPLRDKQALIVPAGGAAHVERTPKLPPFASSDTWLAKGKLDENGTITSHIDIKLRGDDELLLRAVAHQVPPSKYDDLMQRVVASFGYAGTPSHGTFSTPTETAEPFALGFDYKREKAGDWDNLRILPQLEPDGLPLVEEAPTAPIELGAARVLSSHSEIELPPGWTAELPEAVHEKTPWATYDRTYSLSHGTLTVERRIAILQSTVPVADWKAYKKWADASDIDKEDFVQLRKGFRPAAAAKAKTTSEPAGSGAHPENARMVQDAFTKLQNGEVNAARDLLNKVKASNSKEPRLWMGYAFAAMSARNADEAIEDLQKELKLHPDSVDVYAPLAAAQLWKQRYADAESTLHTWIQADGTNAQAYQQLGGVLYMEKKYGEAVDAAQKAVDLTKGTPDARVLIVLGNAQLRAGKQDAGVATFRTLLSTTEDPGMMNNVAYELADANADLPLAEKTEREALEKLTAETTSWTLDEASSRLNARSALLAAAWDTLGWILYREGKVQEGQGYIAAAWHNQHHEVVRDHLVEINSKLGIADPSLSKEAPKPEKTERRPSVPGETPVSADASLWQADRTFPLGASALHGTCEYRLLLAHGKVVRSEPEPDAAHPLEGGEDLIAKGDFARLFPAGSDAHLVRKGMLNCVSGHCDLVLE